VPVVFGKLAATQPLSQYLRAKGGGGSMYQIELTQSLFPAQRDTPYQPTTIAAMIR
jgi:hypothetical protein